MANKKISPFASALKVLLDETGIFDRAEWSSLLGVSQGAISQWVNDKTIPRPEILDMIYDTLVVSDIEISHLKGFNDMSKRPANEVSPNGVRMLPTVWEYMTRPSFGDLSRKLAKLSPGAQEELLRDKYNFDGKDSSDRRGVDRGEEVLGVELATSLQDEAGCPEEPAFDHRFYLVDDTGEERSREFGWSDLVERKHLVLKGSAGCGKTTFLGFLASQLRERSGCSVRNVSLKDAEHFRSVEEFVQGTGLNDDVFSSAKQKWILLDGFDEVSPANRVRVSEIVNSTVERYANLSSVVTTRPLAGDFVCPGAQFFHFKNPPVPELKCIFYERFSRSDLRDLRRKDVTKFFCHLAERPHLWKIVSNPLFFRRSETQFLRYASTASSEAEMYSDYVWLFLDEWDRTKNVVRSVESWASPRNLVNILSTVSYESFRKRQSRFNLQEFGEWSKNYVSKNCVNDVVRIFIEGSGILKQVEDGEFELSHRLFQEYLAALHMVESSRNVADLLEKEVPQDLWDAVVRLVGSISNSADDTISFLVKKKGLNEGRRAAMLSGILAQRFSASEELVETSCGMIVSWLEKVFGDWNVTSSRPIDEDFNVKWAINAESASMTARDGDFIFAKAVLTSLHKARACPGSGAIKKRLGASEVPVVRELEESLSVEGPFKSQFDTTGNMRSFQAEVSDLVA